MEADSWEMEGYGPGQRDVRPVNWTAFTLVVVTNFCSRNVVEVENQYHRLHMCIMYACIGENLHSLSMYICLSRMEMLSKLSWHVEALVYIVSQSVGGQWERASHLQIRDDGGWSQRSGAPPPPSSQAASQHQGTPADAPSWRSSYSINQNMHNASEE